MFNWVENMALNCVCLTTVLYFTLYKFFLVPIARFKHEIFTGFSKLFFVTKQLLSIQAEIDLTHLF